MFSMLEAEAYKRGFAPDEDLPFASAAAWPRVLELYAGSGALAIEALSRGAASADIVERDAPARRAIQTNLERTGLAHSARVLAMAAEDAVRRLQGPYDLVLLDPPYADPGIAGVLVDLAAAPIFAPGAIMVFEHSRTYAPPARLGSFERVRERRHGVAVISLFTRPLSAD
jgi:16S rRNA (guanine966-N2)-methyltransferase